jgi:hypothetical protein
MPGQDPYLFLKSLIAKDFEAATARPSDPLVVALSRDYNAYGGTIAQKLAACLGFPLYGRKILEGVAQRAKIGAFKLETHDESAPPFLYSLAVRDKPCTPAPGLRAKPGKLPGKRRPSSLEAPQTGA